MLKSSDAGKTTCVCTVETVTVRVLSKWMTAPGGNRTTREKSPAKLKRCHALGNEAPRQSPDSGEIAR
jgi:hypothetical protein